MEVRSVDPVAEAYALFNDQRAAVRTNVYHWVYGVGR